jgi:8-oxo-dGTP pyrophosphatase MutT (NUDIX family)
VRNIERQAARLLVLTPEGRALLLRLEPSFRGPFWVTPGGGLDDGESFEAAAVRELREEVGRDGLELGPVIWHRTVTFRWEDRRVTQPERTFLVRVSGPFDAVTVFPDEEPITGSAWFTPAELRALDDPVYPVGLADHLENLLAHGVPVQPLQLGNVVED